MFDIGFWELTMIGVIALLVIGPDKLPGVARTAGKWVGRARRFVGDVKSDIDRELKQEELRKALAEDAGLDEIKQIMNTDDFSIDADDTPAYQVKAMLDEQDESIAKQLDADDSNTIQKDDEDEPDKFNQITDHNDSADEKDSSTKSNA